MDGKTIETMVIPQFLSNQKQQLIVNSLKDINF